MEIECEECGGTNWTLAHLEIGGFPMKAVISALRCKKCGMAFMLADEGKNVSVDMVRDRLGKLSRK